MTSQLDLASYDFIVVSTSAGKDSQAMLDEVVRQADALGIGDRIRAVHVDLGRVEWQGTKELAIEQGKHYALTVDVVRKIDTERSPADLLDRVEKRGMWPSSAARFCTSDYKRTPVRKYFTALAREWRAETDESRPCRILNCMGLRAQESPARAKRPSFTLGGTRRDLPSNSRQHVDEWLPIHEWTDEQVWTRIKRSGVPHHWAYDEGMPRLSCSFCVLASESALVRAAQLRPDLAAEYARVEERIGHTFQNGRSMADIIAKAETRPTPVEIEGWNA